MGLEGPQLRYVRAEDAENEDPVMRALHLARRVEDVLGAPESVVSDPSAHSLRMVRAMAAGLVDELEALVRGPRRNGTA